MAHNIIELLLRLSVEKQRGGGGGNFKDLHKGWFTWTPYVHEQEKEKPNNVYKIVIIWILSETAGLYLHPMPERMLYVLVSEEPPQLKVSCGLSIVAY